MKVKDFYKWLDTVEADYYETEQSGENMITVTFADIDFPTEEEILAEERADKIKQAIKSLEDILAEPYVTEGNAVDIHGQLYSDTRWGFENALEIVKGELK